MATKVSSGGIGFFGILTLILITLKLLDKISISWVWVFAPIWMPIVIAVIVSGILAILYTIFSRR